MSIALASGWSLDADAGGPLLRAPQGALRLDAESLAAIETGRVSRPFGATMEVVLARLGALGDELAWDLERPEVDGRGPRVSVVVPTYQARDLLCEVVESLVAQVYGDLEIVIADGGSVDGSREAVQALAPGAVWVDVPGNPGFAHAINAGCRAASGEHLLLLNNDAPLAHDAVAQAVRVAEQHPQRLAAVGLMCRRGDLTAVIDSLGNVVGFHGFGAGSFAGFVDAGQFARPRELFSCAFTAVLIPREAWALVGELDTRYRYYYEDVDWSLRARMAGMRLWPAPHAIVYHRGSASTSAGASTFKETLVRRSRLIFAGKILRARNAAGFVRRYAQEDVRHTLDRLRDGDLAGAAVVPRAWAGAARQLPSLWQAREELASWHVVPDPVLFRASTGIATFMDGPYPRLDGGVVRGHYLHAAEVARRARALIAPVVR